MVGEPSAHGWISVILGGIAMGGAYAAWTQGMTKGNITVLAAASYFTPVLSCVFAVFLDWRQTRQLFLDGGRCCRCRLTALLGRDGARNEAALGA